MIKESKINKTDPHDLIGKIIDVGKKDTVYRDLYIQRARLLLSGPLPNEEFNYLIKQQRLLADLPNKITIAMEKGDWTSVKELGGRLALKQEQYEKKRSWFELGQEIYNSSDIAIDAFYPGFNHITGIAVKNLPALRDEISRHLKELSVEDPEYKKFYLARYASFTAMVFNMPGDDDSAFANLNESELQELAQQAVMSGNMEFLEKIAEIELRRKSADDYSRADKTNAEKKYERADRVSAFSEEILAKAEALGLVSAHVDESPEYASLYRYAFHPAFSENEEKPLEKIEKIDPAFPSESPDSLKKQIEIYAIHTFINSGGTRYFPDFVAEDFLVENFPDPSKGNEAIGSGLLSRLGLEKRRGLSRLRIENALIEHGPRILKEDLGIDPQSFRLLCIPPDLFLRLGRSRGWGQQEIWTHFDGYEIHKNGTMSALAGGDTRFGGIHDLVTIGRNYESERVVARFAVVKRARMEIR